ncbi:MAG: hypothetical protein H0X33_00725 [Taibaiella sp.]|nr:hypothetical protein [Taibaiella sp.]
MNERIEKIKVFLKDSPGDSFLQHALALEFIKAGNDDEARQMFENNVTQHAGYVATYYHLGKLLERGGLTDEAIGIYEKGMSVAREAKDMHTYNELQAAYEDITY